MHVIEIDYPILECEDGLILGNGDLSVSIYQKSDSIVWRFGKNDVWDRRLDLSDCPKPTHIDEMAKGIRDEGWVSHGYVYGEGECTRGKVSDPERMKEICNGWPAYAMRPYPCPKPVGEVCLHLPTDQHRLKVTQRLAIEKGEAEIVCSWDGGLRILLRCFVPPAPNCLVVDWKVENWNKYTVTGGHPPAWFSVYRWEDPTVEDFGSSLHARARYRYFWGSVDSGKVTTLPPPTVCDIGGRQAIQQTFYPDLEYRDGYRYALVPYITPGLDIEPAQIYNNDAVLHMWAEDNYPLEGSLVVAVAASSDEGGVEKEIGRLSKKLAADTAAAAKRLLEDNHAAAEEFWAKSSVETDNDIIERAWYEVLHGRRCMYRAGIVAPGLGLPCTVQDYSLWHGDYHMNFNYQQCFWGDYIANHIDVGDSFFPGIAHMVEIGRKLARDYWGCGGTFIQLSGYPFPIEDDPYGSGALCRMSYMTGWVTNHYWSRYLNTLDEEWLRETGYPVMRDGAIFYTDFLEKWDDGKYHAFPSLQGESFFTGKPEDYTDQPQVMRHARYCLQSAIAAAKVLDINRELQEKWQEVLDNMTQVDDLDALGFSEEQKRRYRLNPPAFVGLDAGKAEMPRGGKKPSFINSKGAGGGMNMLPWFIMIHLHNDAFDADRDMGPLSETLRLNRMPNGLFRAMSVASHSYIGTYGEAMGIVGPIGEMLLQSWDGIVRVFPNWPGGTDCRFKTLRAEGAFLVSAALKDGEISGVSLHSEKGSRCRFESPWPRGLKVVDEDGAEITTTVDGNVASFDTEPGQTYKLMPA